MSQNDIKTKKVAIVHDFFFQYGGAEKVVETLFEIYPKADLYTSFIIEEKFTSSPILDKVFKQNKVKTSLIQYLFNLKNNSGNRILARFQKHFFFLYPLLMKFIIIKNYDLVIISSTDCGKYVKLEDNVKIVHYCHSPTRYLNDMVTEVDRKQLSSWQKLLIPIFLFYLKPLEKLTIKYLKQKNVQWLANSKYIQKLIAEKYNTNSIVIYPPIETEKFINNPRLINDQEEFYLVFGRISFHKRIDLAIVACLELHKNLIIGGTSALPTDLEYLQKIISNWELKNNKKADFIKFVGRISDEKYLKYQSQAKGFLFPGREDFGITPVECLASGLPIIAFGEGGALEYVQDKINGVLFTKQTKECLIEAIKEFESLTFDEKAVRNSVNNFTSMAFKEYFLSL
jgi:glycosyltransferase involved in cell wall biosynthesis